MFIYFYYYSCFLMLYKFNNTWFHSIVCTCIIWYDPVTSNYIIYSVYEIFMYRAKNITELHSSWNIQGFLRIFFIEIVEKPVYSIWFYIIFEELNCAEYFNTYRMDHSIKIYIFLLQYYKKRIRISYGGQNTSIFWW